MDRRGFFSKLFDSVPDVFFLGIQVIFAANAQDSIWEDIELTIKNHQNTQSGGLKRSFYNEIVKKYPGSPYLVDALNGIQYCYSIQGKDEEAVSVIEDFKHGLQPNIAAQSGVEL